jgi:hypothetical protein
MKTSQPSLRGALATKQSSFFQGMASGLPRRFAPRNDERKDCFELKERYD